MFRTCRSFDDGACGAKNQAPCTDHQPILRAFGKHSRPPAPIYLSQTSPHQDGPVSLIHSASDRSLFSLTCMAAEAVQCSRSSRNSKHVLQGVLPCDGATLRHKGGPTHAAASAWPSGFCRALVECRYRIKVVESSITACLRMCVIIDRDALGLDLDI